MILVNAGVAVFVIALTLVSCQRPLDIEGDTIYQRQAIDLMAAGERLEKEGDYAMALDRYNKACEMSPSPAIFYRIGRCYYQRREYTKAYESLTAAIRLAGGDYPPAQYLLGQTRIHLALVGQSGARPATVPARVTPEASSPLLRAPATPTPRLSATASPAAIVQTPRPTPPRGVTEVRMEPVRTPRPENPVTSRSEMARISSPSASLTPAPAVAVKRTSSTAERSPAAPTPRPTAVRTPERVIPTPTPKRTPTPIEILTPPLVGPAVVSISSPPVGSVASPRRTPQSRMATTTSATIIPPLIRPEEIFPSATGPDLTTRTVSRAGFDTTETVGSVPLLGQWQFHWERAQSFLARKWDQEAVDELLLVLGAQPRHLEALLQLGDAYDRLGRGEKALVQYEKARLYHPKDPKPYFRTGNYYLRHAEDSPQNASYYDRARMYCLEAINQNPKYYFAYHNIGVAYMKESNYETARKWFEKALEIKPDYASAHRNLGLLYEQHLKNPKAALRHYREYVNLNGPDADEVREWIRALEEAP